MDADEREVYYFLKARKGETTSLRDICRYAGSKRKSRYNPEWASPVVSRMVERGILDFDGKDFRIKPIPENEAKAKLWASPAMAAILQQSGKEFDTVRFTNDNEDDYYDKL